MTVDLETATGKQMWMATHQGTEGVRVGDVYMIGHAFLNCLAAMCTLGHARPSGILDYTHTTDELWTGIVRDFVALTSGRERLAPGCEDRLRNWVRDSGWQIYQLSHVADSLGLSESA